jgi:hypothetical protein
MNEKKTYPYAFKACTGITLPLPSIMSLNLNTVIVGIIALTPQ